MIVLLFSDTWGMGNLDSISAIKNAISTLSVWVISIVGLFLVISPILKNAIAGLYASNPKFFDKVSAAKKRREGGGSGSGQSGVKARMQGIGDVILSCFPDVKGFTDFEDGQAVDPKGYFLRAIPAMVICVFIGVFIYYGYPMRIAEKFGEAGTATLDIVLANTDAVAFVENLSTNFTTAKFATDGANDYKSKCINKISSTIYTKYVGTLNDMTKERRIGVGTEIENWVFDKLDELEMYFNEDQYRMAVEARVYLGGAPNLSYVHDQDSESGVHTVAYAKAMSEFSSGSTKVNEDMYIAYFLTFTPVAQKEATGVVTSTMVIPGSMVMTDNSRVRKAWTVSITQTPDAYISTASTCEGYIGSARFQFSYDGSVLTITTTSSTVFNEAGNLITRISGLYYVYDGSARHPITQIQIGSGGDITFKAIERTNVTWAFGEDPLDADASGSIGGQDMHGDDLDDEFGGAEF